MFTPCLHVEHQIPLYSDSSLRQVAQDPGNSKWRDLAAYRITSGMAALGAVKAIKREGKVVSRLYFYNLFMIQEYINIRHLLFTTFINS